MGKIADALEKHQKQKLTPGPSSVPKRPKKRPGRLKPPPFKEAKTGPRGFDPKLVVMSEPGSLDAERFNILRTQLVFNQENPGARVIMVTSALPGEGKTYVAANMGASFAQGLDQHVMLLDCDFRRPKLHTILGYPNHEGLHEYLTGQRQLPDLIIRTNIERLSFVSAGSTPPNPSELISSNAMKECLRELKVRYKDRYIIVDTTPVTMTSETNALLNYVDGIVLVVMGQKTPRDAVHSCIDKLGRNKIMGIVFNGYNDKPGNYAKYYQDYYN